MVVKGGLKSRLYVLIVLIGVAFAAASIWAALALRSSMIAGHEAELRHLGEMLHGVVLSEQAKAVSGEITEQ